MKIWGKCALAGLGIIVLLAIFAPSIAPFEPDMQDLEHILAPMSATHWLGTDYLGRDIFSRILYGARLSLGCAFVILAWIMLLGIGIGGLCGFGGGRLDAICMRLCDVFMSVPTIALSLFFVGVLGAGLENVMIAIILTHWAWYARIVRSIVFSVKNKEYVLLSFTFGASALQRFKRHLLVPILSQCVILASMDIGHIMLHIAGLSFLGLGVQPPTPEWGVMLSEAKEYMWDNPALIIYPGLALFVSVALCNMIGEGLRDSLRAVQGLDDNVKDVALGKAKSLDSIHSAQSLEIEHLCIDMDTHKLVEIPSLCVRRGECTALLGASGSGKSLSALALQGFVASNLALTSGVIKLDSQVINPVAYRGVAFACIMQSPRTCFNPLLSIAYHFKETCIALHKPYDKGFVLECLQKAGLEAQVLDKYPFELSGGMLQRAMIALALLAQAPFVIADEPSSDLDKLKAEEILKTLRDLRENHRLGILLITHDLAAVAANAQYVYIMQKGKIIESARLSQGVLLEDSGKPLMPQTPTMQRLQSLYQGKKLC